jgi:hypothetical protein
VREEKKMIGHMADRYMLIGSVCAIICTKLEALVVLKKKTTG